jgi:elongation factor Ts
MTQITAKEIAELRAKTGMGMMECKRALEEAGGDETKALEVLRKKGADKAAKKSAERETKVGLIEAYSHDGRIGVLVEVLAETDFVIRNEEFKNLAHDLALQIAAMAPKYVGPDAIPDEVKNEEKGVYLEQVKAEGKPENIVEKIVEGKMQKFYSEVCLLNQPFIKDQDLTVADVINEKIAKIGEKITVSRFTRIELGEK